MIINCIMKSINSLMALTELEDDFAAMEPALDLDSLHLSPTEDSTADALAARLVTRAWDFAALERLSAPQFGELASRAPH